MKKLLIILAFSPLFAFAQGTTNFGLKGGLSISSYSGDDWTNTIAPAQVVGSPTSISNKSFFSGALAVNSEITDFFWLKHEFWYVQRGSIVNGINIADGNKFEFTRHYIDLAPILFAVNLKGFQVFAGPQAGIMMFKKDVYTPDFGSGVVDDDNSDDTILDYGALVGAEYEFPFGLNIGCRIFKGFNKLNPANDQTWFNNTTVITTGWTFGANE